MMNLDIITSGGRLPGVTVDPAKTGPLSLGANRTLIVAQDGSSSYETIKEALEYIATQSPGTSNRWSVIVRQSSNADTVYDEDNSAGPITIPQYTSVRAEGNVWIRFASATNNGFELETNTYMENIRAMSTPASSGAAFVNLAGAKGGNLKDCPVYNFDTGYLNNSASGPWKIVMGQLRTGSCVDLVKNGIAGAITNVDIGPSVYGDCIVTGAVFEDSVGGRINVFAADVRNDDVTTPYSIATIAHVNHANARINLIGGLLNNAEKGVYAEEGEIFLGATRILNCTIGVCAKLGEVEGFACVDDCDTYDFQTTNASGEIRLFVTEQPDPSKTSYVAGSTVTLNQTAESDRLTSTGLVDGGILSINVTNTKFDIEDGFGVVANNYTAPAEPSVRVVEWSGKAAIAVTNLATADRTYVAINTAGTVIQSTSMFTAAQLRDYILLGYLGHESRAQIDYVVPSPNAAYEPGVQFDTFLDALGPLNVSGNVFTNHSNTLELKRTDGVVYKRGSGYSQDRKTPNRIITSGEDPVAIMQKAYRNAGGNWTVLSPDANPSLVDVGHYDPGGGAGLVVTATGTKFTIQRIYQLPELTVGGTLVAYGQVLYDSIVAAEAALQVAVEEPTPLVAPSAPATMVFRGWLIVLDTCADLSNAAQAKFITASKFYDTSAGGAAPAAGLSSASNINTSGEGVWAQTLASDAQFKGIDAGSNKVTVTDVPLSHTIEIDVDPANIDVNDLNGPIDDTMHGSRGAGLHADSHTQSHSITSAANHTSTATPGQMLKANAAGLPVDASNTDAQVGAAVSASHARGHAMDSSADHTAGTQGDIPYAGAAGAWARLGAGTAGQLLKTQGAANNPTWSTHREQSINLNQGTGTLSGNYIQANGINVNENQAQYPSALPTGNTLVTLVVNVNVSTFAGGRTCAFTVNVNGAPTAVVATATGTGTFTASATIAITQGQSISVSALNSGGGSGTISRSSAVVHLYQ